ncbi:hypothetical protein [Laspinema olomoucense]|uniref:Uncharacterized protein n=1 Tax=Laspinema olomoucense D3b TaxID=2953688 RepID=A0ABT2N1B0_9CYAN|nr:MULTISPECIES: hypothetical protein [unclassified Laspinema]MCT7971995.1 hypothetical protein [Laspinema sp. D3d]MCT7976465.1 hypothetical protein [Laspinema sp. D3b]MCT7994549.1 hypothetical protein [Laspinema sp. D3c]
MARGSFATMQAQSSTEVTFYYENGHTDSFKVPVPGAQFQQQLPQLLAQPWITFHLIDNTIMVSTAKVVKVEINPPIPELQGPGVINNGERVTTMQRGATGRLPQSG